MKKTIFLFLLIGLVSLYGCKENPCAGIVTYDYLYPQMPNYFYKTGSYWVYRDSIDGITDSQYVYFYRHSVHVRNPLDSPDKLYQYISPGGLKSSTYCGPYYLDDITMRLQSFQNGILNDTITLFASGEGSVNPDAAIYEHDTGSAATPTSIAFVLDWTKIGFLNCCFSLTSQGDTIGTWYNGVQPSVSSGTYTFSNVAVWGVQLGPSSLWFAHPTDLYITSGSGIIKIVQHLPTRDVSWDLINYHILN